MISVFSLYIPLYILPSVPSPIWGPCGQLWCTFKLSFSLLCTFCFSKKKKKINKNIFSVFFPLIQNGMIYFLMTLESWQLLFFFFTWLYNQFWYSCCPEFNVICLMQRKENETMKSNVSIEKKAEENFLFSFKYVCQRDRKARWQQMNIGPVNECFENNC